MKRAAAFLFAAIAGAGCAMVDRVAPTADARPAVSATPSSRSSADELANHLARLRSLNESALTAEAAKLKREPGDLAKVKAAMALSLSPQAEDAEILALLETPARNGDRDVRAMASFLQVLALERRRLKESAAAAGVKLREEKRTSDMQKQRADSLQQKLDALTELEKSLSDRTTTSR